MIDSTSIHPKRVLLLALAPEDFYRCPLIPGSNQLFIGPDVNSEKRSPQFPVMRLQPEWLNGFELAKVLQQIPWEPDITFVKADASCRNHLKAIKALPGIKILLMGDTHHLKEPLQTMLSYANNEPWDLISSEHDRHHLPLFTKAGLEKLIWLPCFTMNPYRISPQCPVDERPLFVGSLSQHHVQRLKIISQLQSQGINLKITTAEQSIAANLYNKHSVSLNVSLNCDLNFRVMEVLAAGGCLLTDRLGPDSGLDLLLTEGKHYLGYSSSDEAADQIIKLQKNPELRQSIAYAGHNHFWSTFSPEQQSKALIKSLLGQSFPDLFKSP